MASNQTPNYGLNQWSLDDSVVMADFNADNLKLEEALNTITASIPHIQIGTYTGTGEYGAEHPNVLTFDFEPKLLVVRTYDMPMWDLTAGDLMIWVKGSGEDTIDNRNTTRHITLNGNTLSWYVAGTYASAVWQLNAGKYYYVAIG